jgi:hypothetical protein
MTFESPPGMAEAGELLGLTTREVAQLVYDRAINFVVVDGIIRIPEEAIEDYRRKAS